MSGPKGIVSEKYGRKEADRRTETALRVALGTAPKHREDMKIQKPKASPKKKK